MQINWVVRFKNPVFWRNIVISIIAPILAYMGVSWGDMTTWGEVSELFIQAVQNPVIVVSVLCSVWNAINDPTTAGDSDSVRAMTYDSPRKS